MVRIGITLFFVAALGAPLMLGCDLTRLAAGSTVKVFQRAAPAFDEQTDYLFAGQAAAGSLMQLEGLLRVLPENRALLLQAAKSWTGYAFGYVEDEMERAELRGDYDEAELHRDRARTMYLRARDLGRRLLELREEGFEEAVAGGPDRLRAFLAEEFKKAEDAPALFWTGYAWGSAINVSLDNPALLADLHLARALIERSVALDAGFYNSAGLTFLGVADSVISEVIGGNHARGRASFEQALEATERRALIIHFHFARTYAVQTQNRELFEQLLTEVLEAPEDILPSANLPNQIAKRRAARYLGRIDELFDSSLPEPLPDDEGGDEADHSPDQETNHATP